MAGTILNAANVAAALSGRIMLDPEMETELSYPVRYVSEVHRGELEGR